MARGGVFAVVVAVGVLAWGGLAEGGTYRFTTPDGTVHYTNAPPGAGSRAGVPDPEPPAPATRVGSPASPSYEGYIRQASERYGVPGKLISAVIRVESGFNPRAVSRKGARGLMQLMPGTASMLGVRNAFDPLENIDGGVRHLSGLLAKFPNDLSLALAAYNAGEQAVLNHRGIPPYPETVDYVARILRLLRDDPVDLVGASPPEPGATTYRLTEPDGTVVYTNIPPSGRR